MSYLSIFLIGFALTFLDLSLLPYLIPGGFNIYLSIAFIVALSLKYSGLATLPLAFVAGLLFDWASLGGNGIFTYLFILIFVVGKILHYQKTNFQSGFRLIIIGNIVVTLIYLSGLFFLADNGWQGWDYYLSIYLTSLFIMSLNLYLLDKVGSRYFSWLEKAYQNRRKA